MTAIITEEDVRDRLRRACEAAGGRQQWSDAYEVSPQYVGDVLRGQRKPGEKILRALGLTRRMVYGEERGEAEA